MSVWVVRSRPGYGNAEPCTRCWSLVMLEHKAQHEEWHAGLEGCSASLRPQDEVARYNALAEAAQRSVPWTGAL